MPAVLDSRVKSDLKNIVGEKNILTNSSERAVYSFDSGLDRSIPSAVIVPTSVNQLPRIVGALYRHKIPFVARGAATSLCGGPIALNGGVVIALAGLKKIGKINREKNQIKVEPGVVNLKLQEAVAGDNLFFPPDPGSQKACTIGGNVATNAGGPHCLKYGVTSNSIASLEIVLPNGQSQVFSTSDPGYDLVSLFVGAEGTLGLVSRMTLQLQTKPKFVQTMVVCFRSMEDAIQSVTDITASGILPATLEAMDKMIVEAIEAFMNAGYSLEAEATLLIEVDGDEQSQLDQESKKIQEICEKNNSFQYRFAKSEDERKKLWEGRRGSYASMARLAPNVLVEDGAVPRTRLPEALKKIKEIAEQENLKVSLLFHAGDGNLHPQIIFDERIKEQTERVKRAGYKMLKACVDLGGTISGEHGIGIDKREAMKWLFSRETLKLFRRLKNELDPLNLSNPDKLIPLVSRGDKKVKTNLVNEVVPETDRLGSIEPANEEQLVQVVKHWGNSKNRYGLTCHGTKLDVRENRTIVMKKLDKILNFDKGNLTIRVQAGTLLGTIREEIEKVGQYLWVAGDNDVGSVIATRSSDIPPLRDQILAMRVLLTTGEIVEFGANTMKNVAGYEAGKLLIGSWGTLGIILDVTFRLFPMPPVELKSKKVQPFVFKDIHKKIKKAFDPDNLAMSRLTMLNQNDLDQLLKAAPPPQFFKTKDKPPNGDIPPPEGTTKYGDGFWA